MLSLVLSHPFYNVVSFVISVKHEVGVTSGINITSDSRILSRYRVLSSMEGVKLNVIKCVLHRMRMSLLVVN